MANQSAKLTAYLYANIASFETGMKKAGSVLGGLTSSLVSFKGLVASTIGGGGLALLASSAVNAASKIVDASTSLGLTTQEFQRYSYGAKLASVDSEKFTTAITALNARIAQGNLPYKSTGEALEDIAEKLKNAKDGIERAAIASDAFGSKLGGSLIPFLIAGKDGLKEAGDEAQRFGLVMSDDLLRSAENLGDKIDILGTVIRTNFQAGLLSGFVDESGLLSDIYSDPQFIQGVRDIGTAFGEVAGSVAQVVKWLREAQVGVAGFIIASAGVVSGATQEEIDAKLAKLGDVALEKQTKPSTQIIPPPSNDNTAAYIRQSERRAAAIRAASAAAKKQAEVERELKRIYEETRTPLEQYNEAVEHLGTLRKQLGEDTYARAIKKEQEALRDATKETDKAAEELGLTFASAFEDAIVAGKSFKDTLKGLADDILRIFVRRQVTEPLTNAFSGLFSGSGGGGGGLFDSILGGIGNFLPSFASGIDRVPYDMTANIHQGEAVLNASDAAAWRAGGGNVYNIDARGADSSAVRRIEQALAAGLGRGAIESRMADSAARGAA